MSSLQANDPEIKCLVDESDYFVAITVDTKQDGTYYCDEQTALQFDPLE